MARVEERNLMRRSILFSLLYLCLFQGAFFPTPSAAGSGPRVVIEKSRIDFGEVNQWDLLVHTFTVTNEGDDTLRIERVSPD